MVTAGEAELEAFAERHLVFEPGAALLGIDLTTLLDHEAPRSWERNQKARFRNYLDRRSGSPVGTKRVKGVDKTFHGWLGVRLKFLDDWTKRL
jgi:hypothetical protein